MTFQAQSQISKVLTMSDKGIRIQIDTQELPPEDIAKLFKLKDVDGIIWTAFKEIPMKEEDFEIPEVIDKDIDTKTPSQRLRNTLFIYWQQNKTGLEFDMFYKRSIEKYINVIKEKLI